MKIIALIGVAVALVSQIPSHTEYIRVEDEPAKPVYHHVMVAEVSAYTSSVDETDDEPFITASGARTDHGVVACPSRYDFGTRVEIAGQVYTCLDRMNARYRERDVFDIWMPEKALAYEWGRQTIEVKVLK